MPLDRLADMQLVIAGTAASTPALAFKVVGAWMAQAWSTNNKDDQVSGTTDVRCRDYWLTVQSLSGPADLLGPMQFRKVIRFESNDMIRMHDLPALDAALRFSVDYVIAGTAETKARVLELAEIAVGSVSTVSYPQSR